MKEIKNQTVYVCSFCGKKSVYKSQITRHERVCKSNPNNWHKCFQYCEHLEKFNEDEYGKKEFRCVIHDKFMYSFKLESQLHKNKERISKLERMPIKCNDYECSATDPVDYLQERQIFEINCINKQRELSLI